MVMTCMPWVPPDVSSSSCTLPIKSTLAEQALRYIQLLYEIDGEVHDLGPDARRRIRQEKAVPVMNMLDAWMLTQRDLVPDGLAISRAPDYSVIRTRSDTARSQSRLLYGKYDSNLCLVTPMLNRRRQIQLTANVQSQRCGPTS